MPLGASLGCPPLFSLPLSVAMSLTVRVLAPDTKIFDGTADEVILPSTTGQMGVLTGHVSLLTALDVGVLRLREGYTWSSIALMGGFAEVVDDEVTVLVNGAERGVDIDRAEAEQAFATAREELARVAEQINTPEKLQAQQNASRARARLQAAGGMVD